MKPRPEPLDFSKTSYDFTELQRELDWVKSQVFLDRKYAAFLGSLLCSMNFVWTSGLSTAATNGSYVYWNPEFFLKLPRATRVTVLLHELWHVAYLHPLRVTQQHHPYVANIAQDILINNQLIQQGYSWEGVNPWKDPSFKPSQPWEEIYDVIYGRGAADWQNPWGDDDQGDVLETDDAEQLDMVNNVVRSMHSAKMAAGSIPGGVEEFVNNFLAPVVPWEQYIRKWLSELMPGRHTWKRPNRRHASRMYLPSKDNVQKRLEHLVHYFDVSGSVTQPQIMRVASELRYLKDYYKPRKITVVQFDTRISRIDVWEDNDPFEHIEIRGGGGTCFADIRQHIMDTRPTAAMIWTDLLTAPMEPGPTCPILWGDFGGHGIDVPFGTRIRVKV